MNVKNGVYITTYSQLQPKVKNSKMYSQIPWAFLGFDEVHKIRNENSKLFKACMAINADMHVGLSGVYKVMLYVAGDNPCLGTPLQNYLKDITTLLKWLSAGGATGFVEVDLNQDRSDEADNGNEKMYPFTLRRLIKNVEPDLYSGNNVCTTMLVLSNVVARKNIKHMISFTEGETAVHNVLVKLVVKSRQLLKDEDSVNK